MKKSLRKAGQPTKYREEHCEMLYQHMAGGLSFRTFGVVIGADEDTMNGWCKTIEKFSVAKKLGRKAQELFFEKTGRAAMLGKIPNFNATAYIWLSKNMLGWRDKIDIDSTHTENINITSINMTNEELLAHVQKRLSETITIPPQKLLES